MSMFPQGVSDGWFRLGRLQVGTVMAVVLLVVASWVAWIISPSLPLFLALFSETLALGEVWRLVTWPFANTISLWSLLNLFFFWWFGSELEGELGRRRMLTLLAGIWAALTVASAGLGLLFPGGLVLAGIGMIQLLVLLIWIGENPTRPFFFGIPAWVIGAVIVGLQIVGLLVARDVGGILALVVSLGLVAVLARRLGLLRDLEWIPGRRRRPAASPQPTAWGPAQQPARPAPRAARRAASDRERLDELLDKINQTGLHGLSDGERRELMKLRERLRGS